MKNQNYFKKQKAATLPVTTFEICIFKENL
jgi:hypothetical protein